LRIVHYLKWVRRRDGGVVQCVLELAPAQARAGHDVTLLTADDSDVPRGPGSPWLKLSERSPMAEPSRGPFSKGLRSIRLGLWDPAASVKGRTPDDAEWDTPTQFLTRAGHRAARRSIIDADAVHIHGPWSTSNIQIARLCRILSKPYVVSAHGMLDDWCMAQSAGKKRLHLALMGRSMLDGALCVHCSASEEARQVRAHTSAPTRVVPLPMDLTPFRTAPDPALARTKFGLAPGVPQIVFLSRLHPKKGADKLVEACALLKAKGRDFQLTIAGPEQDAAHVGSLRRAIAAAGFAPDRCRLVGMVVGAEKLSLMAAADVFVLPTSQENFGFVLLEAVLSGARVITSKGVDIWKELQDNAGATILPDASPGPLADAIARALDSGPADTAKGRAWAMEWLDEPRLMAEYERMYRDEPGPAPPTA
jgi:glycosyltransferase involved in cell wall biosynthesis